MEAFHSQRLERAFSSGECTSSRVLSSPMRRLCSMPIPSSGVLGGSAYSLVPQAMSRASSIVSSMATLDLAEDQITAIEPETELLSGDRIPDNLGEYRDHVADLQTLERLKGELRNSLFDLDSPDLEDSALTLDDWTKLSAARREYLGLETEQRRKLEERKKQRALKREARKAQAALSTAAEPKPTTTAINRRANNAPALSSGARATARSRSRLNARWGRTTEAPTEAKNPHQGSWNGSSAADASITNHKLLSAKDEVELSKKVKHWIELERVHNELSESLGRKPSLSEWCAEFGEEEHIFMKKVMEGAEARTKMLICNQRLVVSIARKYQGKGMELTDLIQEGMVGLLRGVEKFDHTKGFKFSTYATWWIRQSISRSITELSRMIRLPAHLNELMGKVTKFQREFALEHMREPTEEELAKGIGTNVKRIRMVRQASLAPTSIHEPMSKRGAGDPEASTVGEQIEDQTMENMESQVVNHSMHRDVNAVLNTLSAREHGIIRMRYGLDDGQPRTLEEIGVAFHVTRERIRQIENKALANLKDPSRNSTLVTYVDGEAMSLLDDAGWKSGAQRDSSQ